MIIGLSGGSQSYVLPTVECENCDISLFKTEVIQTNSATNKISASRGALRILHSERRGQLALRLYVIYVWFKKLCCDNHSVLSNWNVTLFENTFLWSYLLCFFNLISQMPSSADFSGFLRLKCKSRVTFDIVFTKYIRILFSISIWRGAQSHSPPHPLDAPLKCIPVKFRVQILWHSTHTQSIRDVFRQLDIWAP